MGTAGLRSLADTSIPLKMYKDVSECDQELAPFDITEYVDTVEKLNNLTVRVSATGKAASDNKVAWVDFVGIHVEC